MVEQFIGKIQDIGDQETDEKRRDDTDKSCKQIPEPSEIDKEEYQKDSERDRQKDLPHREKISFQMNHSLKQRHL